MTETTLPVPLPPPTIRTPDQRLRVFVSSTLQELAPERGAVRQAIEKLRLTPVMFELGARPHPPRDLYRAYLQQSQVFVGVYWERYGWVAPGETVSGLEDEYALSGTLPKLIYVKASAKREPRLDALLSRVRGHDDASYKSFDTPEQLQELLADDLALLLTERFEWSAAPERAAAHGQGAVGTGSGHVPAPLTPLIGRESELAAVQKLLERGDVRLVTLVGSGGIGKTRLALAVAAAWAGHLPQGVRFVSLVDARDRAAVLSALARALGLRDSSGAALLPDVQRALAAQKVLLVLDNFEQVLDAAPLLSELLAHAPGVKVLVTSRSLLRLGGEHSVELGPLALPDLRPLPPLETLRAVGSVQLFVERARAVKPDFELTVENAESVARLCLALDGAPLAIELAAARVRVLPPAAMLARLEQRLPLLTGGAQDLPARQRTLRDTIDWSVQLLSEGERQLFTGLGVFSRTFTLEAAEAVCGDEIPDVLGRLSALVDSSLVQQDAREEEPSFSWLWTVREYALERLGGCGQQAELQRRHAGYFHTLALGAPAGLLGEQQSAWLGRLDFQYDNLRATMRHDLDGRDFAGAAQFGWNLYVLWWVGGHLGEIRGWMEEALAATGDMPPLARAQALYFANAISFWQQEQPLGAQVVPGLEESAALFLAQGEPAGAGLASLSLGLARFALQPPDVPGAVAALELSLGHFRAAGHTWGEGMALIPLGRVALMTGDAADAEKKFRRSLELTQGVHDGLGISIALNHLGWTAALRGDVSGADHFFRDGLQHSAGLQHDEGVAYGLEGLLATAVMRGDAGRAARLLGASEARRTLLGLRDTVNAGYYLPALGALQARSDAATFTDDEMTGAALSLTDTLRYALEEAAAPADRSTGAPHDPTPA